MSRVFLVLWLIQPQSFLGGLNIWLWKIRGGKEIILSKGQSRALLHTHLCPGTCILMGKRKGGQHQGSQWDWLRPPGNSQGCCFRLQACPGTRSGKINSYGLAHQMSYLPWTGQFLTFNSNVHPSLFPGAHPVGAPRDKPLPSWAVAVVEREREKQALDLRFLQNSGAVPKQNPFGIQVSKTTFVSSNF